MEPVTDASADAVSISSQPNQHKQSSCPSNTLFVTDIPVNIVHYNLEDLFSKYSGYRATRRLQNFAFVEFDTVENASLVKDLLHGYKFSRQDRGLVIDFDRDRERKRKPVDETHLSRRRATPYIQPTVDDRGMEALYDNGTAGLIAAQALGYTGTHAPLATGTHAPLASVPQTAIPRVMDAPTTVTLCVKNLPVDVTERELSILFRFMPGFERARLVNKDGRAPFAFVDFDHPDGASVAKQALQGYPLDEGGPGIIIEYDRARPAPQHASQSYPAHYPF